MPTTTTYTVMKRPQESTGSYEQHYINDAPLDVFNGPAEFDDLDEAYACAAKLGPKIETSIKVTETSTHVYYI